MYSVRVHLPIIAGTLVKNSREEGETRYEVTLDEGRGHLVGGNGWSWVEFQMDGKFIPDFVRLMLMSSGNEIEIAPQYEF